MARANREHSTLSDARHTHLVQSRQALTPVQGVGARDFTACLWWLSRACALRSLVRASHRPGRGPCGWLACATDTDPVPAGL